MPESWKVVPTWAWTIWLLVGGFLSLRVADVFWGIENTWVAVTAVSVWVISVLILQRMRTD